MIFFSNRKWPPRILTHPCHKYCSRNFFMVIFVFRTEKPTVTAANIIEKLKCAFGAEKILKNLVKLAKRRHLRHFRCELTRGTY